MAGADETPNGRAGSIVQTRYDVSALNLLLFLSGIVLPRYLSNSAPSIVKPDPVAVSGTIFFLWGAVAN